MGRYIQTGKKKIKGIIVLCYKLAHKKKLFKWLARYVKPCFPRIIKRVQKIITQSSVSDIVNSELCREGLSRTGWSVYEELAAEIKKIKKGR